jgi:hypothetical protein
MTYYCFRMPVFLLIAIGINPLMSEHNNNNPNDLDTSLYKEAEESIN